MLSSLQPNQAVQVLNDRVKRISKINTEIADWLQERRRVEEQYILGLRRLGQSKLPGPSSELGIFNGPWQSMVDAVGTLAHSHQQLSDRIEQDVELPLRNFSQRSSFGEMTTMSSNLTSIAKSLDEAQAATEKLGRKGGKASTQKIDAAASKLESARQQWESQAPYIFESLQALDESRINQLRDVLTQYQTLESDCAQRAQDTSVATLSQVIEIATETEILAFVNKMTHGRTPRAPPTRASTTASISTENQQGRPSTAYSANVPQPSAPSEQTPVETPSEPATPAIVEPKAEPPKPESKLRRLGTILKGRRQSVYGAAGPSPQKGGSSAFGRLGGKEKPGVSPRGSSGNLRESNHLGALAEHPSLPQTPEAGEESPSRPPHEGANGYNAQENIMDSPIPEGVNGFGENRGVTLTDEPTAQPLQPTAASATPTPAVKDAEGFTIPAQADDPITAAQKEAAATEDADQLFKLNIQNKPIEEEDPEAKRAALSSVASSLRAGPAVRRSGTTRGRRDVRNTIYAPAPIAGESAEGGFLAGIAGSPSFASSFGSRTGAPALAPEASIAGTSDTQSVRSGHSLGNLAHAKHPEMTGPGLHGSIIEHVSIVFKAGGEVESTSMAGELGFVNNATDDDTFKTHETIKINNYPNLERIGPNRIFVQNSTPDQPDQFSLDLSHISKMAPAFSYRVFAPESDPLSLAQNAPLFLNPAWKPQGDKLGLLLQYQLNPSCTLKGPVTLQNVVFIVTYEGKASGAQTKPSGTHLKDRHIVYWRLGEVTLTPEPQKIVCRIVGSEGAEPIPGHVEARWEYVVPEGEVAGSGISVSRLQETKGKGKEVESDDDPFADDGVSQTHTWVDVPLSRKLVSGKYEGR